MKKFKDRVRALTKRNNGKSLREISRQLNALLRGWYEYFKHSHPTTWARLDKWVRLRLRSILRRRQQRRRRGRGRDHQRWPNAFFEAQGLAVAVIFLTMHKDEMIFNAALEAGVRGFVVKDGAANDIVGCIRAVAAGQTFFSPVLSGHFLKRRQRADALDEKMPGLQSLTTAERRILKLIAEEKTNKQIAAELLISVRTVENHRANICAKLGLKGTPPLLTFALTHKAEL